LLVLRILGDPLGFSRKEDMGVVDLYAGEEDLIVEVVV
jgi:hypothetical protein